MVDKGGGRGQLCECPLVRDDRVKSTENGNVYTRQAPGKKRSAIRYYYDTRIRARRIGYGYLVAERSISNKAEKAERAFSYYI